MKILCIVHNAPPCSPAVLPLPACADGHLCCKEEQKVFEMEKMCFGGKVGWRVADEEFTSLTVTPKQIFQAGT